jgi:hypothetical protein
LTTRLLLRAIAVVPVALALLAACVLMGTASGQMHTNVAQDRPYRLEPPPNYSHAPPGIGQVLTDGAVAEGKFWINGQSVGWQRQSPVIAGIEMNGAPAIERVRVHTGANTEVGIYYPSQLLAYGRNVDGSFAFLGSSALQRDQDSPDRPTVKPVDIVFAPMHVSEIVVVGFPRSTFMFINEIEAISAPEGGVEKGRLPDLEAVADDAKRQRHQAIAALPDAKPQGPDISRRWIMPLSSEAPRAPLESALACQVERIEAWQARDRQVPEARAAAPDIDRVALVGGRDYVAWRVVNWSERAVDLSATTPPAEGVDVTIQALAHVQALDYSWVADAVTPFERTTLPPRSMMTVLATLEPGVAGRLQAHATLTCDGQLAPFGISMIALEPDPDVPPLHGNLWTYIHQPSQEAVVSALRCNSDFLTDYGIDTTIVHQAAMVNAKGELPSALLREYFRTYRTVNRILLFMNLPHPRWDFLRQLPDDDAADWLRAWWQQVRQIAKEEGVTGELLLYPIDEIQPDEVTLMEDIRALIGKAGIEARLYATIPSKVARDVRNVDVIQLLRPEPKVLASLDAEEIHGYDAGGDNRLDSPQTRLRHQGWSAFDLDLHGIGFWSLWDGTGLAEPETGWSPFAPADRRERDHGMLYQSPDGCAWPSLRLLAWSRGIEEHRVLKQCSKDKPEWEIKHMAHLAAMTGRSLAMSRTLMDVARDCLGQAGSRIEETVSSLLNFKPA